MEIVALETIRNLQHLESPFKFVVFAADDTDRSCIQDSTNLSVNNIKASFYPLWEQSALLKKASGSNIQLLHCTANTAPLLYNKPLIVTIHDLIFLESIDFSGSAYQNFGNLYRRWVVPKVARKARIILTVSEYSKKIIAERLRINEEKIRVIHNGINPMFHKKDDPHLLKQAQVKYNLPEQFLLHFGNTAARKNTKGVLKAYQIYRSKSGHPVPLVISGCSTDVVNQYLKELQLTHLTKDIIVPGYVQQEDLPLLYNLATIFLYPSLNEGFGMPVIEAMACGTPVITSTNSSLPEVAGNAALLTDALDPEAIGNAISSLLEDKALYEQKIREGFLNAERFSWKIAAQKTLDAYREILL